MFTKEFKLLVGFVIVCLLLVSILVSVESVKKAVLNKVFVVDTTPVVTLTPTATPAATISPKISPKASFPIKVASPTAK